MSDKNKTTESHSSLFGLAGQKGPSSTAGSGAGSGVVGTSGHTAAANKAPSEQTVAGMPHGGQAGGKPGSGSELFTPSQGSGKIGKDA